MRIDVLTLFPEMFGAVLGQSILRRAQQAEKVSIEVHDLRDYSTDRHRSVDDRPYGGGPGMVLSAEPVYRAVESLTSLVDRPIRRILLSPQGRPYDQACARDLSRSGHMLLLCGHYEGFDERIREGLDFEEISVGDYVLTGGELPSMILIDSVVRLLPGVLGDPESAVEDSFSNGLLDHPHYTRPPRFRGMEVPEVLRSGDHGAISRWREQQREERTRSRRPRLWERYQKKQETMRSSIGGREKECRDGNSG